MTQGARIPPHSLDAERAVLGSMLLQKRCIELVIDLLTPEEMYSEANARILEAILALHAQSLPIDTVTLRDQLMRTGRLQQVGGDEYLLALTDTIPSLENCEAYARLIKEKAQVRRLITACHGIAAKGYGDYGSAQDFVDESEKAVFDVANAGTRTSAERAGDVMIRVAERMHEAALRGERVTGLKTGFSALDTMTTGMHEQQLIIIAGRPGMGKTSFALNIAANASRSRLGTSKSSAIAIFSMEMSKEELVERMCASEARVSSRHMRTGALNRDEWQRYAVGAQEVNRLPIFVDDTPSLSILELRAKARRLMAQQGLAALVVDYLQLMRSGTKTQNREQEISEISRALKALAKELAIPVIALSQLNRGVESRSNKDKRPQLSDLRESGAIEQDADTIWFVYRDEVYHKESLDQGIAEIIVGKQRSGPTGTVKLRFFSDYTRFDNLASEEERLQVA